MFLFKKNVDKSLLYVGLAIPQSVQNTLMDELHISLDKGETKPIVLSIGNNDYEAIISKYNTSAEMVQIHYGAKSLFAKRLRDVFKYSADCITNKAEKVICTEYAGVYANSEKLCFECVPYSEIEFEKQNANCTLELVFEEQFDLLDPNAHYEQRLSKIRKVNKDIGKKLKEMYGYKCQLCGSATGEEYGAKVVQVHHIDYFSKSMNNDMDNLIVLCPNHHSIIHDQNPVFDKDSKSFVFPNGKIAKLLINFHL